MPLERIDLMEPREFEQWVLSRLARQGYQVSSTPASGDAGADGIALAPLKSGRPNYLIQCKHTQNQVNLDHAAIEEVLRARSRYPDLPDEIQSMVVTNAKGFTSTARRLAIGRGVKLVARDGILLL